MLTKLAVYSLIGKILLSYEVSIPSEVNFM